MYKNVNITSPERVREGGREREGERAPESEIERQRGESEYGNVNDNDNVVTQMKEKES